MRNNNDDDDDEGATRDKMVDMLRFVAFARRPLRVIELATLCELYPDYDEARRLQFTKDHVDLCRLMIVVQDEHVRLLHKSVKDFLVGESLGCDKLRTNADMANQCIDHILHCAGISNTKFSYLEYADEYWPEHARRADTEYAIDQHQAPLFDKTSSAWAEWLGRYNMRKLFEFDRLDEGFTVLHAAAKWNVLPLLCWGLNIPAGSAGLEHDAERPYNDAMWATLTEKTPLEEAAQAGSLSVMHILLRRMMVGSKISKRVLHAAARNSNKGKDIIALLLDQRGDQVQITQDVVKAAAGNEQSGTDIMTLLLERRGDQIQITQDVVVAAAANWKSGIDIMALLLDRQGDQIQITQDIVKAAAGNERSGTDIRALLLDRRGDQIQITQDIVKAAAGNWESGTDIMALLLDRQGDQIQITQDVVVAAAGNIWSGKDIMTLLLDRQGDQIQITQDVVVAAAANWKSGIDIMTLLLDRQGDQVQITQDVVKAAAGNIWSGKDIMALLLDRRGDQVQITQDMVKAAAGNGRSGTDIMALLDRQGDLRS
jgi:hypothetical protein